MCSGEKRERKLETWFSVFHNFDPTSLGEGESLKRVTVPVNWSSHSAKPGEKERSTFFARISALFPAANASDQL